MDQFDRKLLEHIDIDLFARECRQINEKFGIFPDAENIRNGIQKFVELIDAEYQKTGTGTYMNNDLGDMFCKYLKNTGCFFKECRMFVLLQYNSGINEDGCGGAFNTDTTQYETRAVGAGEIVVTKYVPDFSFVFRCSRDFFLKYGVVTFIHEILHAYEFYNRIKNGTVLQFKHRAPDIDGEASSKYLLGSNEFYKAVDRLFDMINHQEVNAYSSELFLAVMQLEHRYHTYEIAIEKIKKCGAYRWLVREPKECSELLEKVSDKKQQDDIINFANRYIENHKDKFKTYKEMLDYFSYEADKLERRALSLIGKWLAYFGFQFKYKEK